MTNYDNLPGVLSQTSDYNLGTIQSSTVTTDSVLILGTAIDGPSGVVIPATSITTATSIFGDFKDQTTGVVNGASLIRGLQEAYKAGCTDIRLMRITGKKASTVISSVSKTVGGVSKTYSLVAEAVYEGSIYNTVSVYFDNTNYVLKIAKPATKMTDYEKSLNVGLSNSITDTFNYSDYVTLVANQTPDKTSLADFIRVINKQQGNNVVVFKITDELGNDLTTSLDAGLRQILISDVVQASETFISKDVAGDDEIGLSAFEMYKRLGAGYATRYYSNLGVLAQETVATSDIPGYENGIYDILTNYKVDVVIPMDVTADAVVSNSAVPLVTDIPKASLTLQSALEIKAVDGGYSGNSITVEVKPAAATGSVTAIDGAITIIPVTGADKASDIAAQITASTDATSLVTVTATTPATVITTTAATALAGGTDVYVTPDNFARQLAQACASISSRTHECLGVIGSTPSLGSDLLSVKNKVNTLLGKVKDSDSTIHVSALYDLYIKNDAGQRMLGSDQKPVDIGGYISIVACPELVFSDSVIGYYAASGAAAYAGLITTLSPEVSTTNKSISGLVGLRYEISGSQLNDLTGNGYVTFRNNYDQGIVVTDGVTAAGPLSDFQRLTTKRITNAAMAVVRQVCSPFIGLPNNLPQRNAITTAIQAGLDGMKQAGAIQDGWFDFYSSKTDQRLGNAIVDLTVVPVFEFRKIRVYVSLSNPS